MKDLVQSSPLPSERLQHIVNAVNMLAQNPGDKGKYRLAIASSLSFDIELSLSDKANEEKVLCAVCQIFDACRDLLTEDGSLWILLLDDRKMYRRFMKELGGAQKITEDPAVRKEFYKRVLKESKDRELLAKFLVEGGSINNLSVDKISTITPIQRVSTSNAIRGEDDEMIFPDILAVQEIEHIYADILNICI